MQGFLVLWILYITRFILVLGLQKDVVFMIDTSESVSNGDVKASLKFIVDVTKFLNIGPHHFQVSIVLYNAKASYAFKLDAYQTRATLLSAIQKIPYSFNGSTDTAHALNFAQSMFSVLNGGRKSAEKAVVVLTDGNFDDPVGTNRSSNSLTSKNITVYGVLLGNHGQDINYLTSKLGHIFSVSAYKYVCNLVPKLVPKLDPQAVSHLPDNCPKEHEVSSTYQNNNTGVIAGTTAALCLGLLSLLLFLLFRKKLRKRKTEPDVLNNTNVLIGKPPETRCINNFM